MSQHELVGLPGVVQRMSLDQVPHVVEVCYPAQSQQVSGGEVVLARDLDRIPAPPRR